MSIKQELAEILDEPQLTEVMDIIDHNRPFSPSDLLEISKYSDKILFLIEHKDEMSNTDLQGASEAIVRTILADIKS
jgi:hypothetical protein